MADITDNGRAGYHIVFNDKADLSPAYDMSWEARGQFVVDALQATAEASQKNVRAYLDSQNVPYQHFWAENIIIVESSEIAVFNTLTTAFPEINSIVARPEIILYEPDKAAANIELEKALDLLVVEPNIAQVSADDAWGLGVDGTGIVVANIDTGVRYTHEALVNQYRGNLGGGTFDHNYNWWDPNNPTTFPTDTNGHGTHTMGTTVGDDGNANQIGVAPGAQWIACRSFAGGSVDASLLECGQFMLAPWDLNEANPDPTLRPHVVNNSWGDCGQTYDTFYESTITAWHAAGIYPVFSNGNASNCGYSAPPGLNTVGNPARSGNVSGVGSSGTNNGQYASHSNWGPTDNLDTVNPVAGWEDLKPQFLAPGVSIRSSVPTSDTAYESAGWSGTSMSSPHVTGGIALIWQAASCLVGDYATTETILEETATPILYDDGSGPRTPNYAAGWGEINLLAAVQQAQAMCGPSGTVTGTVVDAATSNPIEGASVTITFGGDSSSATTDSNGQYTLNFIPAGTGYVVDAAAFGYLPDTATVDVVADQTTVQDFALTQAPSHTVSGVVTDATTGWPLYASIAIGGADIDPIWTNPETGAYSIVLPEGINYTFEVAAWVSGYVNESRAVGPLTADLTEDFGLNIDVVSCSAPGYGPDPSSTIYFEAFDTSDGGFTMTSGTSWAWGTPVTWPASCTSGTSCWGTNLNGTYPSNANEILVSPSIDLTAVAPGTPLSLTWQQANHIESATYDHGYAEVSIDGGTTWTIMWEHTGETSQVLWRQLTYDLTSAIGNNVLLRWRLTSDSSVQYNGLYIDDVFIGAPACVPTAGGLLVGNVYNGNTGEPFVGATVTTDATSVSTVATPNDDNVDDGFYTVFVAEGTSDVTASYTGFTDETVSVTIADGTTTGQDFSLGSGALTITPPSVEFNIELGSSDTESVVFENTGSASIDFALSSPTLNEEFEGTFPPTGWTVVNNGGACDWVTNSDVGRPNHAGGNGISAAADSDTCGNGSTMDTELISPPFSLAGATVADLDFILSYRHLSTSSFSVKASVDGGSNWDVLQTWTADESAQGPGTPVNIDLSAYLGQSSVLVSFHYQAPGWHWWTQIDNVVIVSDSSWLTASPSTGTIAASATQTVDISVDTAVFATPGTYTGAINVSHTGPDPEPSQIPVTVNVTAPATLALLEGTVSSQGACDSNPFPIAGAEVVVTNGTDSWTLITDSDGYYFVYIDESDSPVDIAVTAVDHEGDSATGVVLIGQQTTTQDFDLRWLQPCLDVSVTDLSSTLVLSDTDTATFTINNSGGADLTFELRESDGGFDPSSEGISWETMAPLPSGRVFNAVVADQNGYIYVIGGTSDGGATIPTTTNFRYNTATNSWDTMAAMPTAVDAIDGVEVNGKIYIPGGDTSADTYVYDIASDSWSTIAANNGYSPRSQYQVVAIDNNVYVLGGIVASASASTTEVWVLDTTTETWSAGVPMQNSRTSFAAGAINGEIYVAGGVLFPGFTPDMTAEKFDGTTWSYTAPVPNGGGAYTRWSYQADGVGENGLWLAAGRRDADWNALDHAGYYDPSSDSWTDTPTIPTLSQARVYMEGDVASDGYFYVIGGRDGAGAIAYDTNERIYVGSPTSADVPWLDETPVTGTVAADGGSEEIQVTFDASAVNDLGQYYATLRIISNDPTTPSYSIPVTMTVVGEGSGSAGVDLDPATDTAVGAPGEAVTYLLTVTNLGTDLDTFNLAVSGNNWSVDLMPPSITLNAGDSAIIAVVVNIPADATDGTVDEVTVTATSTNDPTVTDSSVFTTTVEEDVVPPTGYTIYLPVVVKP